MVRRPSPAFSACARSAVSAPWSLIEINVHGLNSPITSSPGSTTCSPAKAGAVATIKQNPNAIFLILMPSWFTGICVCGFGTLLVGGASLLLSSFSLPQQAAGSSATALCGGGQAGLGQLRKVGAGIGKLVRAMCKRSSASIASLCGACSRGRRTRQGCCTFGITSSGLWLLQIGASSSLMPLRMHQSDERRADHSLASCLFRPL